MRQLKVFATGLWMESEPKVKLPVAHKDERMAAVVWVYTLGADEAVKLHREKKTKIYINIYKGVQKAVC